MNVYNIPGPPLRKKISPNVEVEDNQSGTELPCTFRGTSVVINARYTYSSEKLKRNVSVSGEYSGITFHISFLESPPSDSKEAVSSTPRDSFVKENIICCLCYRQSTIGGL